MVALACLCSVCLPLWRCSWVGQGRVRLGSSRARVVNSFPAVLCTARAALLALSCVLCCCRGYRWVRVCVRVQVEGPGCPSPAPTWSLALPAFRRLRDCVAAAHSKVRWHPHHARTHSRPHTHTLCVQHRPRCMPQHATCASGCLCVVCVRHKQPTPIQMQALPAMLAGASPPVSWLLSCTAQATPACVVLWSCCVLHGVCGM